MKNSSAKASKISSLIARVIMLSLFLSLSACVVGHRPEERKDMYREQVDCEYTPEKCIGGVPW